MISADISSGPEAFPLFWLNTAGLTSGSVILLSSSSSGMVGISVSFISS